MPKKLSFLNPLFFVLLIIQSLVLIVYLAITTFYSPYLQLLDQYSLIFRLVNYLFCLVFFITALAFLILPADLIFEKGETAWLKFKDLLPILLVPWLDTFLNYLTNPNFSWLLAIKKTAIIWYVGGLLAYATGFIIYGQIKNKKTNLKTLGGITLLFIPWLIMGIFIYQNIWAYDWLKTPGEIFSWHLALVLYYLTVMCSIIFFKNKTIAYLLQRK